jgi:4-hydroxy-4-methyl-2-oxoglutarate aldolase
MSAESPVDRRWKFPVLPFIVGEPPVPTDPRLIEVLSGCYVPDISDAVGRMYTVHNIRSLFEPAIPLVGPATTAKCPPGDNLAVKVALRHTRPGDVLVVDAQGFGEWCLGGFQMLQRAIKERGLKGLLVHGAYRDASEAKAGGFPIYCSSVSIWSGPKIGPGEVNAPVCCGGVIVHPGDIVCAGADGIAVVPRTHVGLVTERLAELKRKQDSQSDKLAGLRAQDDAMEAYVAGMQALTAASRR